MKFRRRIRTRTLREKHRRALLDRIASIGALIGALILLVSQLSALEATTIHTIQIEGNEALSQRELFEVARPYLRGYYFGLFTKRHILLYPRSRIEGAVSQRFPRVGYVDVDLENLTTISLTVTERKTIGHYCLDETTCYLIDDAGFIFAPAFRFTHDSTFMYLDENATTTDPIGSQFLSPPAFRALRIFVESVESQDVSIEYVRVETPNRFVLVMEKGGDIIFDPEDGYDHLLGNLTIVLSSRDFEDAGAIEYVDLRFGNRIFYKAKE